MIWRVAIVLLVAAVSPVAATVCEVACASPLHHAHRAAPAVPAAGAHDHHHHHTVSEPKPLPQQTLVQIASSDCDPLDQLPARVRTVDYDAATHSEPPMAWWFRSTAPSLAPHAPFARPPLSTVPIPLRI